MFRTSSSAQRRILVTSAGLVMGAVVFTGCSTANSTNGEPAAATSTRSGNGADSAVDPNAAEINPPGDIPDNQAFVPFTPQGQPFTVSVPEGWARTGTPTSTTFTDKLNSVTIQTRKVGAAPTVDSVKNTEMPAVSSSAAGYQAGETTQVTRQSGPVIMSTYQADSEPDPVTGKVVHDDVQRYVYYQDGTEVVLTLAGPAGADNVDPWKIVTDSFAWS
ncbi:MAG: hypothetical protein WA962_13225 [Ornithinimicrobium sp.]